MSPGRERLVIGPVLAEPRGVSSKLRGPNTRLEVLLGRSFAMCVHPYAAWRAQSAAGRLFVLFTYFAASYAVFLTFLLVF